MTEFEIASLFNELLATVLTLLETFMAALFAMLATAYFVAPRLTRAMSATIIGLFTLFSTFVIFLAFAESRRVAGFGVQLDEMANIRKPASVTSSQPFVGVAHRPRWSAFTTE